MRVNVDQLASPCVTRVRGQEASRRLQDFLCGDQTEVDFRCVEMVSFSFLDGFVSSLMSLGKERDVVFLISKEMRNKLSRIVGIRNATIHYSLDGRAIHQVEPKRREWGKSTFLPKEVAIRRYA
jgi:hypothetical protein